MAQPIVGNDNPNTLYGDLNGFTENDIISGLGGDDIIYGLGGVDLISGGEGNDWIHGGSGDYEGLYGDNGDDTMLGDGINTMYGGSGNDLYYINHSYDTANEEYGQGIDTVRSSISYTLRLNIEKLVLEGTAANGTGNGLDNVLKMAAIASSTTDLLGQYSSMRMALEEQLRFRLLKYQLAWQ